MLFKKSEKWSDRVGLYFAISNGIFFKIIKVKEQNQKNKNKRAKSKEQKQKNKNKRTKTVEVYYG